MAITITGVNGDVINLGDSTGRTQNSALGLQASINGGIAGGTMEVFDVYPDSGNPNYTQNLAPVGILQEAGSYNLPNAYQYLVVADDEGANSGAVTLSNNGFTTGSINVLSGRTSGTTYNAGNEKGQLINTVGNLTFNGAGKTGAWVIYSGNGNSTITTTNGNNQVNTGTGKNTVTLGTGNNSVYSQGQDTITGGNTGYQSVTLTGAKSEVTLHENALVVDIGRSNTISVDKNATVTGGSGGSVTFNAGDQNIYQAGSNQTVSAVNGSELKIIHGVDSSYTLDGKATFLNGAGNTSLTVNAQLAAFGASDSNYTINANGSDSGLFVADKGNETLNASGSTAALQIYANTVSGAQTNFVASGGSGNDTLVAGTGQSTFTGGAGDNLFMFNKDTSENGHTVIKDFSNSSGNKVGLFNYGLDDNSLQTLLNNSQNDASGNAVLNLEGHAITFQGVAVSDLNTSQFEVLNATNKTV